jgi:hypothetical protein
MNRVLVFTERILPTTCTFIPLQVNELQRYTAQYVGLIPAADRNLPLAQEPILLSKNRSRFSRCRRELYRWSGVAPQFHARVRQVGSQLVHAHFAEGASPAVFLSKSLNLPLILHLRGGAELMPDAELRRHLFELPFLVFAVSYGSALRSFCVFHSTFATEPSAPASRRRSCAFNTRE